MARRFRLLTEALFTKLLNSQQNTEQDLKEEQTHILSSKDIPDEIKPVLYRDVTRNQQDFRKTEEQKPLLVQTATVPVATASVSPVTPKETPVSKPRNTTPMLKKLSSLRSKTARFLSNLGMRWTSDYKVIIPPNTTLDVDVHDVIKSFAAQLQYDKLPSTHEAVRTLVGLASAPGAPDPHQYLTQTRIKQLFGTRGSGIKKKKQRKTIRHNRKRSSTQFKWTSY